MSRVQTRKIDYRTTVYCTNTTVLDVPVIEEIECDYDEMAEVIRNSRKLARKDFSPTVTIP